MWIEQLDWIKCSICPRSSTNKFSNTNKTSSGVLIKFVAPGMTLEPSNGFQPFVFGALFCSICYEMFQEVCAQCIMSMTSTGFVRVTPRGLEGTCGQGVWQHLRARGCCLHLNLAHVCGCRWPSGPQHLQDGTTELKKTGRKGEKRGGERIK